MKATIALLGAVMMLLAAAPATATPEPGAVSDGAATECDRDYVKRSRAVWAVIPNGTDDTANVGCAIEEAKAAFPEGSPTIELRRGTFHLDFLFIDDFNGRIQGAGRANTTIEPLEGGLDCVSVFDTIGFVGWIAFLESDVILRDLGLSVPDVACTEPYIDDTSENPDTGELEGFLAQDFNAMVVVASRSPEPSGGDCGVDSALGLIAKRLDISVNPPDFEAPVFNPTGAFNTFFVVGTQPADCDVPDNASGDVTVKKVDARGVGSLIQVDNIDDSTIRVFRNTTHLVDAPVILTNNEASTVGVFENSFRQNTGVGVVSDNCTFGPTGPVCLERPMHVRVYQNRIDMAPDAFSGVAVFDGVFAPPQTDARIFQNDITLDGAFAGVGFEDVQGGRISRNSFHGTSVFAAFTEGTTSFSEIRDNDMTDHLAFEASILLGELTESNIAVRNAGATVIDLGTNNTVDVPTLPPGPPPGADAADQPAPRSYGNYLRR